MHRTDAETLSDLVLTIFRVHAALTDWGDEFSAPEGLSSARWQMLGALALAGEALTAPQMAARMGVTRQGAQKQLNLLVGAGLVGARPNPTHKRSCLYVLTGEGRACFDVVDARWRQHAERVSGSIGRSEVERAAGLLSALADALAPGRKRPIKS